jgi:hypothetical protein
MNNLLPAPELKLKRKPGRPRSKRSEEAIIRATTSLLADERYADLTVSKVAGAHAASNRRSTAAGHRGALGHRGLQQLEQHHRLHVRGDVMSDLLDPYRQFLRILHRPPSNAIMPTLVDERAHNPALAAVFDPLMQRRRDPVRVVLRRAMERGQLPKSTDVELAVDAIMGVTVLRMYFHSGEPQHPRDPRVPDRASAGSWRPRLLSSRP